MKAVEIRGVIQVAAEGFCERLVRVVFLVLGNTSPDFTLRFAGVLRNTIRPSYGCISRPHFLYTFLVKLL